MAVEGAFEQTKELNWMSLSVKFISRLVEW